MNRLLAIVAATAAAAAVAAAITIPAGADETSDPDAQFVNCLRSHGADIPAATRGVDIKRWIIAHEATARDALDACNPKPAGPAPEELVSCLRSHGLDVPSANGDLKRWIVEHLDDANAKDAFKACHFDTSPPDKADAQRPAAEDLANCLRKNGADVPANLDGVALKQWVGDHESSDAVKACVGGVEKTVCGEPGPGPKPGPGPETKPAPAPTATPSPDPTITLQQ